MRVPIATLRFIASSIFKIKPFNSPGTAYVVALDIPLAAALSVEILKILCASSTCALKTTGYKCILAILSLSLIIASSCLTVIGIPFVFLEIDYSLLAILSLTYIS